MCEGSAAGPAQRGGAPASVQVLTPAQMRCFGELYHRACQLLLEDNDLGGKGWGVTAAEVCPRAREGALREGLGRRAGRNRDPQLNSRRSLEGTG